MGEPRGHGRWWPDLKRALHFIREQRATSLLVLLLAVAGAALSALEPLALGYVFDALAARAPLRRLGLGLAALLGVGVATEVVNGLSNWLTWKVRLNLNARLLEATVERLSSLPLSFHNRESVGGIMTRVDRGINGFVGALSELVSGVLPALAYLTISLVVMIRLDARLSLVVLFFAPLPALIGAWAAREQTRRERALLDRWVQIFSRLNEVLAGIAVVKSFVMEDEERRRFVRDVESTNRLVLRGVGTDTRVGAARNLVALLARLAAIGLGSYFVVRGEITVGTLVVFVGYVGGLFGPVQGLVNVYQTLRRASVSLEAIFSILDEQDPLRDAPGARPVGRLRGDVAFENVSFSYPGQPPILRGITMRVSAGEQVALVGPSGAGKSTLMALLLRLHDPTTGRILVDGLDIRTLQQRALRRQIGVVLQESLLFNDTIRNNIAYGRPGASWEEIEAAARAANAHDFILRLPDGYDTVVGERGGRLSMGQRQRIAIARALLKDPPILILDEATSALDAESEALVQAALDRLVQGRTTFVIAHRLATVVHADRILVLKDGAIVESGRHEELCAAGGYYASLVERQTRGLLPVAVGG
ncbi:MAG TPA: ABC transporter ATP-binding protein [Longimicrobiales bacterium]